MRSAYEDPPEFRGSSGGPGGLSLPTMTPVTKKLLIINAVVFLIGLLTLQSGVGQNFYDFMKLQPDHWRHLFPFVPFWQLVTYGFLHSQYQLGHILMNLLGLYFFGTILEAIIGPQRFLTLYLTAIALGGVLQLVVALIMGDGTPAIGASGGVMCTIVAAAVMRPDARMILLIVPMTLKTFATIWVVLDIVGLLMPGGNTAHWVHLAGAGWGFFAARRRWIWWDPIQSWSARRETRAEQAGERDKERLDELLQQIHDKGIQSLSRRDRDFLKRVSQRK